ncbi:MAG: DUF2490 domain-containing protein, partial [Candidatus Aminicenantes bacterium]|nr:DUF2490 domain-containing protein [Candidatus Aminicenantes bacterium]
SFKLKVNDRFTLALNHQIRCHEETFQDPFLYHVESSLTYKLPKNFSLALIYRRQTSDSNTIRLGENRFSLEAAWKARLDKALAFDGRFRTEIRDFDEDLRPDYVRLRLRVRLTTEITVAALHLKPFVASEPFWDVKQKAFTEHRLYLGTGFPLSDKAELQVYYIRQDLKDKDTNHVLSSGISLSF